MTVVVVFLLVFLPCFQAFTSWLNGILSKREMEIKNIRTDLNDGVKLINFLELLSGKKFKGKYEQHPPSRIQKIENLFLALQFLQKEMLIKPSASAEGELIVAPSPFLDSQNTRFLRTRASVSGLASLFPA